MTTTRTYDLAGRVTAIQSITIRELTAADYFAALERAEGPDGGRATDQATRSEAIAEAIAEVDGVAVARPYPAWMGWGARTGAFVARAYGDVNELTATESFKLGAATGPMFDLGALGLELGFKTIRFREITTKDELVAMAEGKGSKLGRGAATAYTVAAAVVELDGAPLTPERFLGLSIRAAIAIQILNGRVNTASEDDLEDFVKAARATESARGESA